MSVENRIIKVSFCGTFQKAVKPKRSASLAVLAREGGGIHQLGLLLTLNCLACQIRYVWLKFDFKLRRDNGKNAYEHRTYESVDDDSQSWVSFQKLTENKIQAVEG